MLKITIPERELFDEVKSEFVYIKETELTLEHSLVSVSKWEAKYKKPFMGKETKTREEVIDYIKFMTITKNVDPNVYRGLTNRNVQEINDYIQDPMTATWFSKEDTKKNNNRVITSEIIYYWMIALNIPIEFQRWHFNRLITLIEVCNEENKPPKDMSKREIMKRNSSLNERRKKALNTRG